MTTELPAVGTLGAPQPAKRVSNTEKDTSASEILQTIGAGSGARKRRWIRRSVVAAVVVLGFLGAVLFATRGNDAAKAEYVSTPARRADLRATVEATGTVKAVDQVEVGAEISGTVQTVRVDFNDRVKAGQVLCEIDSEKYAAAVAQGSAQVAASRAELTNRQASARQAALAAERSAGLWTSGTVSKQQLEIDVAASARAEAAVTAARAQIRVAGATLETARIALRKTKIRAPIDGVVLSRSVEPGQTVTSSFQTPVLFTLARDLTKMEVEIDIDEADVGRVAEGQEASFTVDAYAENRFPAKVNSIHNLSTVVDNVVTYRAILAVDNSELMLRPGMTTTVTIISATRHAALLVSNAALRFTPPSKIEKKFEGPSFLRMGSSKEEGESKAGATKQAATTSVWTLRDGEPLRILVEVGLSDGEWTEVVGGTLEANTEVLVDVVIGGG